MPFSYQSSKSVALTTTPPILSNGGVLSISPASGSLSGSMSIGDFVKLSAASSANTASTIVQRDSSGNFTAGTITAALTGTASNASNLGAQLPGFYTARANQTGTQTSNTISDFDTQVRSSRIDQLAAPTSVVGFAGQRITAVATPLTGSDAANKDYADALISTGNNKGTARAAATGDVFLAAPGAVMDGVTLSSSSNADIVLLSAQAIGSQNGLYIFNGATSPLTRATNADISAEVKSGLFIFVSEGTSNGSNGFTLITPNPIVLGTTALNFTQTSGAGQITAGNGLTKTGNTLNAGAGVGILTNPDDIAIDTSVVARKYQQTIGDGTANPITITHGLGNPTPTWSMSQVSSPFIGVTPPVAFPTANTVTFTFSAAPTTNQYRVTLIG